MPCVQDTFTHALGQAHATTIGYLVYNPMPIYSSIFGQMSKGIDAMGIGVKQLKLELRRK